MHVHTCTQIQIVKDKQKDKYISRYCNKYRKVLYLNVHFSNIRFVSRLHHNICLEEAWLWGFFLSFLVLPGVKLKGFLKVMCY